LCEDAKVIIILVSTSEKLMEMANFSLVFDILNGLFPKPREFLGFADCKP
jgi:hypothetical protein